MIECFYHTAEGSSHAALYLVGCGHLATNVNEGEGNGEVLTSSTLHERLLMLAISLAHQSLGMIAIHSMVESFLGNRDEQFGQHGFTFRQRHRLIDDT